MRPINICHILLQGLMGHLKLSAFSEQKAFYENLSLNPGLTGEQVFYTKTVYESSPSDRIIGNYSAGNSWAGSNPGVVSKRFSNSYYDEVRKWLVVENSGQLGTYNSTENYNPGELLKTISIDEDGKQIIEFKDKSDHVILRKVQITAVLDDGNGKNHSGWSCTYYIYDDYDLLRAVLQPNAIEILKDNGWTLNSSILDEFAYRYEYDERKRMVMKKLPGTSI